MSKSYNDYQRSRVRDYDDDYGSYDRRSIQEKHRHRKDKRISNALRSKDVSALYEDDEDY